MSSMEVDHGDFSQLSDWPKRVHLWQDVSMYPLRILKRLLKPALRHRILINYEGEAEGVDVDGLIVKLLEEVRQGASVQ